MMRSAKKTYEIDMLHGAILPKLLRFAVPLTLSTMLQLLFNAADVVVVGIPFLKFSLFIDFLHYMYILL